MPPAVNHEMGNRSTLTERMTDYARQLLDELMGADRNRDRTSVTDYADEVVCKHFLAAFCPNELFTNTKSDLGPCFKLHEEKFRSSYVADAEREQHKYEEDFFVYVRQIVRDLDRRIKRGKDRLDVKGDGAIEPVWISVDDLTENTGTSGTEHSHDERQERIILMEERIKKTQAELERCGEEGLVDEAQDLNKQVESMQMDLVNLRADDLKKGEKRMTVCDVCGAFLVVNDAPERIQSHLEGKQHTGFILIREAMDRLNVRYGNMRLEPERNNDRRSHAHSSSGGGGGFDRNRPERDRRDDRRDEFDGGRGGGSRGGSSRGGIGAPRIGFEDKRKEYHDSDRNRRDGRDSRGGEGGRRDFHDARGGGHASGGSRRDFDDRRGGGGGGRFPRGN